jgi:hypothetical protein
MCVQLRPQLLDHEDAGPLQRRFSRVRIGSLRRERLRTGATDGDAPKGDETGGDFDPFSRVRITRRKDDP